MKRTIRMTVDLNKARLRAIKSYIFLCDKLNKSIKEHANITIDPDYIKQEMDSLRVGLVTLGCSYFEGSEEFRDLSEEFGDLPELNPENDE